MTLDRTTHTTRTPPPHILAGALWIVGIVIALALRFWDFEGQILADDEWHALREATNGRFSDLLTSFGGYSGSPPLALLFKLLSKTVGLSELTVRAPMMIAGIATVVVFPRLVARILRRSVSETFLLLLAASPLLVYYSRYARPYSASIFFEFVSVLCFFIWWTTGRTRYAIAVATLATLASYLHLSALPTVLAPFVFAALHLALSQRRRIQDGRPGLRELVVLAAVTLGGIAATLGPILVLDWSSIDARAGRDAPELGTILHAFELLAGSGLALFVLGALLGAALGLWSLIRSGRQNEELFALFLAWVSLCTLGATVSSSAARIEVPIVFVRYNLWLLPAFLLLVAIGFQRVLDRLAGEWAPFAAKLGLLALVLAVGPMPRLYATPNDWTNHAAYQYTYGAKSLFADSWADHAGFVDTYRAWGSHENSVFDAERERIRAHPIYQALATKAPRSLVVVEAPFFIEWHFNPYHEYQRIHRQTVKAGLLGSLCPHAGSGDLALIETPGARFENFADLSRPTAVASAQIDVVILHMDLRSEVSRAAVSRGERALELPPRSRLEQCVQSYVEALGEPIHADDELVVFATDTDILRTVEK